MGSGQSTTARSRSAGPGLELLDLGRDSPKWGGIQGKPIRPLHTGSAHDNQTRWSSGLTGLRLPPSGGRQSSSVDSR